MTQQRKLTRLELLQAAGIGVGGVYLAGCMGSDSETPGGSSGGRVDVAGDVPGPNAGGGRKGGEITVGWTSAGNSFDPAIGYDLPSWDALCCLLTAPLLVFSEGGGDPVANAAAELPRVSRDGTELTIKLRRGVSFHNGRPVTAEDYKYSWERVLDADLGSWASSYLYPIEGAQEVYDGKAKQLAGVRVVDEHTLAIRLTAPDATFLNVLAQPYTAAVPREEVERLGKRFEREPVGAGPFRIVEYDSRGQRARFERNPDYFWKGLPYLDAVEYRWGIDEQLQLLQLQRGSIDAIGPGIAASLVPKVNAQESLKKYVKPIALHANRWISLNVTDPKLRDPRVRQALNWAVDREQIARLSVGESEPWGAPFPKNLPNYRRTVEPYGHDPERARSLLEEAGVSDLSFELMSDGADPWPQVMQILEQQLQEVGVQAKLRTVSTGAMQSASEEGNFDAYGAHWYMVQPTALDLIGSNYVTDASANYNGYSNERVDQLTKEATTIFDEAQRNDRIAEIEAIIAEDAPGIFLASLNFLVAINPELENFNYNPIYGTYYDRLWRA